MKRQASTFVSMFVFIVGFIVNSFVHAQQNQPEFFDPTQDPSAAPMLTNPGTNVELNENSRNSTEQVQQKQNSSDRSAGASGAGPGLGMEQSSPQGSNAQGEGIIILDDNKSLDPSMDLVPDYLLGNPTEYVAPRMGVDGYVYEPAGRRDPFKPFTAKKRVEISRIAGSGLGGKPDLGPLEFFEINSLSILAILWDVGEPRAIIKDPGGKSHVIKKGAFMGKNNGFVAEIREGEVVVVETFVEGEKIIKVPQVMTIGKVTEKK